MTSHEWAPPRPHPLAQLDQLVAGLERQARRELAVGLVGGHERSVWQGRIGLTT